MIDLSESTVMGVVIILGNFLVALGMDKRDKRHVEAELERIRKMIGQLFDFKDGHLKDSADTRLEYSKSMSEVKATIQVNQAQYGEILRRLDGLDKKIDRIETRDEV